jgi:hypothetical protein
MKRLTLIFSLLALAAPMAAWSEAEPEAPEVSLDGLERVDENRRRELYRAPGVDWSIYDKIQIDEATVAFRKNWLRDQNRTQFNRIRKEDMERIRTGMVELFDEVFSKELADNGGYELTDEGGENVLRITPYIVDLNVYSPDPRSAPGIQRSYAEAAGRMTLKLHMYDSHTGDLIAVFSENRETMRRGYVQWTNTVTNRKEFRLLLQSWAKELREGLQEAQSS